MANNSINFNIGFKVNDSGLKLARAALDLFVSNGINDKLLSLINRQDVDASFKLIRAATKEVGKFEEAMTLAYNVKLGTVNLERFNEELAKNGTSLLNFKEKMMLLGPTGQQTYAQMASGLMNVKYETVETTTLLDKLGDSLRRALLTFTSINIINKVKGSIGEAYGYVKNLDSSLNDIRIVTGKSADEMDRFAEKANKAAASLGKATTDYTKASTIFYQQGLGNEDVEARTEVALKVANTTGADTSKAADLLTAIWNGFNIGAEDAEKSIDVVAAVAAKTASNLDEMATAMSKVASMANSMGVSEELLAALLSTVIAVTRLAPESVGTAFKTIYARIADIKAGSEDAEISLGNYSGKLAALGINVLDTAGNLKDMGQVIEEVGASWGNYSKELLVAIAGIMGGLRQVNQIRALFDNWDKYTETMKVAAEAEGTLQLQQDTYMESAEGQLQKLRTEWEGVLDSLLKSEDIIKVAKGISPLILGFEKIVDALGGGVGILQKFSPLLFSLVSPQISQSLGKIANSFQAALINARLAELQINVWNATMQNTLFTDKYANSIKQIGKDYVNLMNTMSAELRNDFLASMQRFVDVTSKEVSEKFSEIAALQLKLSLNGVDINPIGAEEDIGSIIDKLRELENASNVLLNVTFPDGNRIWRELRALQDSYGDDLPLAVKNFLDALFDALSAETGEINITDDLRQAYAAMLNELNGTPEDVERLKQAIRDYIKTLQDADQLHQRINQTVNSLKIELFATSVMQITLGFIALRSAISQVIELGNIWDDEDLTASEKMSLTLTTIASILTMTIPSLITAGKAISSLSTAHLAAAGAAEVQAGAEGVATGATNGLTIAIGTLKLSMWELVAIATAIAAIIGTVVLVIKAWEKENKKSSENLKEANEKLEEAKEKYDELRSSLDKYRDIKNTFKDLKEGTLEWKDAVTELNDEVLSLIEKYPELQQFVLVGKNGALALEEEGVTEFEKIQEKEYRLAQGASFLAGLTTKRDEKDKLKSLNKKYGDNEVSLSQYNQWLKEAEEKDKKLILSYLSTLEEYEGATESLLAAAANEIWNKFDGDTKKILESFSEKDLSNFGIVKENLFYVISKIGEALNSIFEFLKKFFADLTDIKNPVNEVATTIGLLIPPLGLLVMAVTEARKAFDYFAEKYKDKVLLEENTEKTEALSRLINDEYFLYRTGSNLTLSDIENKDYTRATTADVEKIRDLISDEEALEKMSYNSGKSIQELKEAIAYYVNEAPQLFNLPIDIVQEIEEKTKNLGNETKKNLTEGLEDLLKKTNMDYDSLKEFTDLLTGSGTAEGLEQFNKYLEENNIKFEELPEGILGYINALEKLNSTTNVSIDSISGLMSVMSKTSSIKFGDTFSAKDFEGILLALEKAGVEWENFFTKVGDKFKFIGTDVKEFSKEMDDAFIEKIKEAEKEFEGLKNLGKYDDRGFATDIPDFSASDVLNLGDSVLNSLEGWTAEGAKDVAQKIINGTATKEEIAAYDDLTKKLQEAASNEKYYNEKRAEWADEYIGSYVHNLDTLGQKLEDELILQEDVDKHLEQVRREELLSLGISEEAYKKYVQNLGKELNNLEDEKAVMLELKVHLNKEETINELSSLVKEISAKANANDIDFMHLGELMKESLKEGFGKGFVELLEITDWTNFAKTYKAALEGDAGALAELDVLFSKVGEAGKEAFNLVTTSSKNFLASLKEIQQELKKTSLELQKTLLETLKSLVENKRNKIEDRMAHASGADYSQLRELSAQYRLQEYNILQQTQQADLGILQCEKAIAEELLKALPRYEEIKGYVGQSYEAIEAAVTANKLQQEEAEAILRIKGALVQIDSLLLLNAQELEDFYEYLYLTIDKTADELRELNNLLKELDKLQKEAENLTGQALTDNLRKLGELRKDILKTLKEQLKILRELLKDNQQTLLTLSLKGQKDKEGNEVSGELQSYLKDTYGIKIKFDTFGGVANVEEILKAVDGSTFANDVQEWINKINDNADAVYDLELGFLDLLGAVEATYDETLELNNINQKRRLNNALLSMYTDRSNPEYAELLRKGEDIDARELRNKESVAEATESTYTDAFKSFKDKYEGSDFYNKIDIDENGLILLEGVNTEYEEAVAAFEKWSEKFKDNKTSEEAQEAYLALVDEYGDLGAFLEAAKKVNEAAKDNIEALTDVFETTLSNLRTQVDNIQKITSGLTETLNQQLSEIAKDESLLYGDDKVANLEAQKQIQEQINYQLDRQVLSLKTLLEDLKEIVEQKRKELENVDKVDKNTGKKYSEMTEEELNKLYDTADDDQTKKDIEEYREAKQDLATANANVAYTEKAVADATREEAEGRRKALELDKKAAQEKLKTAEDSIKRETSLDHALSKQLLEVDEAINKVKRSQNGLTGPALISAMLQEVALLQLKQKILKQQKEQIDAQILSLIKLYSLHLSTEYGITIDFKVDETGVTNVDALYKSIENLDEKAKGAAMQDIQNFISTLNGLAGNALSAKKSVDSLGDSIEDLNKKIKETQKAELFRVKEERWSNIDQELKKIARELSRVEKLQKNLTGDALIKNLEHLQQLLEKLAEAQKNKLAIMKAELQTMQTMLALEGVLFTSDGLIANYAAVMAKGDEKLNGYMQSYQQFYDLIGDLEDSILDTYDKKADLEAEKMAERLRMFNTKIDIELDLTKAKREWLNFKREFLNTLNDMSQLNDSIAEKCKQNVKDIKDMTTKDTVMLTDHVNDIIQEIKIMQAGGTSDLYGIDQATALSDLANYRQQLQDTLSSLADKIKETEEAFLQQLEKIKSKFDDLIGNYETILSIIEHDMNLIKLLRGDDAYDELANYYDKSTKNYEAELQTLRLQVDYWKNLMDSAQPGTEEWEKFLSNWKDALNKLNSAVDAAVLNLIDKYKNAINKIMADFEKKITNGSSLDKLKLSWDWQKQEKDFYLDIISSEYEIEKLRMKINKAAEEETDPAKRAKILLIGDKQIKLLLSLIDLKKKESKVRLYDVDLANKQLELELKKQALEDAKDQKTSMRLRRDAEGNYRYEYVADLDKINELKESILDAELDIYEFTVKNQRDLQDLMYENVKEFEDAIRDLVSRRSLMTEDEYNAELQRIKDHFGFMDDAIRGALDKAAADVTDAATTEAIDLGLLYQELLDKMSELQKRKFAEDIVPTFISAITEMKDIIDGEGGLINAAKIAFDELDSAFNELLNELNDILAAAGVDFDTIIAGIDDTINEMQALIEDNDELLVLYLEELDVIRDLIDELHDLMDAYRDVYDAAMDAIDVALELRETAREAMEEYNDLNSMANATGGAAANTGTSGGVPAGNYAASKNSISKKGKTNNTESDYITYIDENGEAHTAKLGTNISTSSLQDGKLHSLTVKDSKGNKQTVLHTLILFTGSKDKALERATGWDTTWGEQNTDTQINDITYKGERADNWKWDEKLKKFVPAFATGGYTGSWGNEGKIAILHEKELVLNQDDTKNILRAVAQVRANTQIGLSSNDFNILSNMIAGIHNIISDIYSALVNNQADTLTLQAAAVSNYSAMNNSNITNNINANFPNAGNMNEIKSAIMGLQNYTSLKIHSNQRVKSTTTPNAYRAKSF